MTYIVKLGFTLSYNILLINHNFASAQTSEQALFIHCIHVMQSVPDIILTDILYMSFFSLIIVELLEDLRVFDIMQCVKNIIST